MNRLLAPALIAILALPIAACGDKKAKSATENKAMLELLEYAPADTPYMFAATEAMPDAVTDKMQPMLDELKPIMTEMFSNISQMVAQSDEGAAMAPKFDNIGKAMSTLMEKDSAERFGFGDTVVGILYGNGLLPVYRGVLKEPGKFGPAVDALFAEMDVEITSKSAAGIDYRNVAMGESVNMIVAQIDGVAVVTLAPAPFDEDDIALLLGKTKPAKALQASTVKAMTDKYNYLPQGFGWIDIQQIAATFLDEPTGINAALLDMIGEDRPQLDAVCVTEMKALSGIAPRMTIGYTDISTDSMTLNPVFELRSDIAAAMIPVAGKVPGLTTDSDAMMKFGLGLNLGGMREYIESYVGKVVDNPYECAELDELNASARQMVASLNQPVPPMVDNFQGFFLELNSMDGIDLGQPQIPDNLDVNILLAMDNINGLIQFGQMMVPQLASIDIEPNGKAVELPPALTGPVPQAVFAAMTDNALGLSIGPEAQSRAGAIAASDDVSSNTLIAVSMDMGAYADLMESLEGQMASEMSDFDPDEGDAAQTVEAAKKQMELSARLQRAYADTFEREVANINITENGLEMPSTLEFR
ncbi:MAG: hypothetical protein AAFO81_01365 [Pseudomonadota bacterium]